MAIWQFALKVFPDKILKRQFGCIPSTLNVEKAEEIDNWQGYNLSEDLFRNLEEILPSKKSWSVDIKQFGNLDENCIELSYEDGQLFSFIIRLDVREVPVKLIDFIFTSLTRLDLTIYTLDGAKVLSRNSLLKKIYESPAATFLQDPNDFLDRLK